MAERPGIMSGITAGFLDVGRTALKDTAASYQAILTQHTGWQVPDYSIDGDMGTVAAPGADSAAEPGMPPPGPQPSMPPPDPEEWAAAMRVMVRVNMRAAGYSDYDPVDLDRPAIESPVIDGEATDVTGQKRLPRPPEPHVEPKHDFQDPDAGGPNLGGPDIGT